MGWRERAVPVEQSTATKNWKTRAKPTKTEKADEPSIVEALGRGAAQGVSFGFADELSGLLAGGANVLGLDADGVAEEFQMTPGEAYEAGRDVAREADEAADEEHGVAFGGGRALGTVIGSALPVGRAAGKLAAVGRAAGSGAKGASAIGALVGGTGGALSGAGDAESLDALELAASIGGEALVGGLGGAVLGPLVPVAARALGKAGKGASVLPGKALDALRAASSKASPRAQALVDVAEANPVARGAAAVFTGGKSEAGLAAAKMLSKAKGKAASSKTPEWMTSLVDDAAVADDAVVSGLDLDIPIERAARAARAAIAKNPALASAPDDLAKVLGVSLDEAEAALGALALIK